MSLTVRSEIPKISAMLLADARLSLSIILLMAVVYIWRGWDSTNSTSTKNSRFSSNKTKKLTKVVNRKPKINQKKAGTLRGVRAHTPKNHEKNIKN
jgi:hypothetical protein